MCYNNRGEYPAYTFTFFYSRKDNYYGKLKEHKYQQPLTETLQEP